LFALGMTGLWIMTTHPKIGPWFNIVGQVAWFTYGVVSRQWGFIASSIGYAIVFSRMLYKAYQKEKVAASATD